MELHAKLSEEKRKLTFDNVESFTRFDAPWKTFKTDAEKFLKEVIVSHKRKQKILIQKQNVKDKKKGVEKEEWQLKIRGALHQETVYGRIESDDPPIMENIKQAFELSNFIIDADIQKQVIERLDAFNWDTDEAIASLKEEKIRDIKNKEVKRTEIKIDKKFIYRLPIESFGGKKNVTSFINKVLNDNAREILNDHLHRFCFQLKTSDEADEMNEKLKNDLTQLLNNKIITDETLQSFYDNLKDSNERQKVKGWLNGKIAFSGEGLKILNSNRRLPINAVKVLYSKTAIADALEYISRGFVKTGSNYCLLVMQRNNEKKFIPISFFDSVKWLTKQFNIDKKEYEKGNFNFPEYFNKKIEYINNIVIENFQKENPSYSNYEVLFLLQNDDLVEFTHPDTSNKSIYRVVKITGAKCYFTPHNFSRQIIYKKPIKKKRIREGKEVEEEEFKTIEEYDSEKNCSQFYFDEAKINQLKQVQKNKENKKLGKETEKINFEGIRIQEHCVPIKVNRLDNIFL